MAKLILYAYFFSQPLLVKHAFEKVIRPIIPQYFLTTQQQNKTRRFSMSTNIPILEDFSIWQILPFRQLSLWSYTIKDFNWASFFFWHHFHRHWKATPWVVVVLKTWNHGIFGNIYRDKKECHGKTILYVFNSLPGAFCCVIAELYLTKMWMILPENGWPTLWRRWESERKAAKKSCRLLPAVKQRDSWVLPF